MGKNIEDQSAWLQEEINTTDSSVFESPIRELETSDYNSIKKNDFSFENSNNQNSNSNFENTKRVPSTKIWKELIKFLIFVAIIATIAILIGYFLNKKTGELTSETYRGIIKKTDINKLNSSDYEKSEIDDEYYEITTKNKDIINSSVVEKEDFFELQSTSSESKCTNSSNWDKNALGKNQLVSDYLDKNQKKTRIAIIDSGINTSGNNLKENIDYKKSINIKNKSDGIKDENGHGTNVALIIKSYIKTEMVIIKVTGKDNKISTIDTIKAINYAINSNVDVINISVGGGDKKIEALQKVIQKAESKGIVVIGALSNKGKNNFPAGYSGIIKTGSYDNEYLMSNFSNPKSDLFFPGECLNVDGKNYIAGNSYAAPILSSVILMAKIYQKKGDGVKYYIDLIKKNSFKIKELDFVYLPYILNIENENTKYVNAINLIKKELEDIKYVYLKELKEKIIKGNDINTTQKNIEIFNKKYLEVKKNINIHLINIENVYKELGIKKEILIKNSLNELYIEIDKLIIGEKIVLNITEQKTLKNTLGVDSCIENTTNIVCPKIKSEIKSLNNLCQNKTAGGKNYICGIQVPIILSGSQLPASGSGIHVTIFDNQQILPISIFQGDSRYSYANKEVGKVILEGLDKKQAGLAGGIVNFYVDINGVLSVKVTDINKKNNEVLSRIENIENIGKQIINKNQTDTIYGEQINKIEQKTTTTIYKIFSLN